MFSVMARCDHRVNSSTATRDAPTQQGAARQATSVPSSHVARVEDAVAVVPSSMGLAIAVDDHRVFSTIPTPLDHSEAQRRSTGPARRGYRAPDRLESRTCGSTYSRTSALLWANLSHRPTSSKCRSSAPLAAGSPATRRGQQSEIIAGAARNGNIDVASRIAGAFARRALSRQSVKLLSDPTAPHQLILPCRRWERRELDRLLDRQGEEALA